MNTIAISLVVGTLIAGLAIAVGPRTVNPLTSDRRGDPNLSQALAEHAPKGSNEISAFTISKGDVTFAGLGADENTEHEIGSVTKVFTAQLLKNAIDRGELTLDTTVDQIIDVGDAPIADVTLGELADHTSGMPRLPGFSIHDIGYALWGANPYRETTDDILEKATTTGLDGRGEYTYSNFGVALLGHLVAINADTTYEELLHSEILDPLGMTSTYVMTAGSVPDDAPRGHRGNGWKAAPWETEGIAPAGAIRSTAHDMALFARYVMEEGLPNFTWVRDEDGTWHNGGTGGYSTFLTIDGDSSVYVANNTVAGVEDLGLDIMNSLKEEA